MKKDMKDLDLQIEIVEIEMNREEESMRMTIETDILVHINDLWHCCCCCYVVGKHISC